VIPALGAACPTRKPFNRVQAPRLLDCSASVQHGSSTVRWHTLVLISDEGLVNHRSAVRGRDLRDHPDLTASNAAWGRAERRSGAGHYLWALPPSSSAGIPTCLPQRLLLGFSLVLLRRSLLLLWRQTHRCTSRLRLPRAVPASKEGCEKVAAQSSKKR
jgi:hypothetical protein